MKLIDLVDKYLENPYEIHTEMHKGYHHPSSSSCIIRNEYNEQEVVGSCLRKVYWEHKGVKRTNPMSARGSRICAYGKGIERFEVEQYKELGIWRDNNVKFINSNYKVSGEADCIVFDKEKNGLRGVEIKSGYDYKFRSQVVGTPTRPGKPKYEHLMQTMLYVDYFKFPFNIVYIDRGNAARQEYEITLNTDGTPNIDNRKLNNGISIPRIVARFKELDEMLEDNTVPRRDFQLKYSKEKLDQLRSSKRMGKANTEEFDKSGDVDMGDWQCSYCFSPSTLIYNDSLGLTKIQDIKVGDKVMGYNSLATVTNVNTINNNKNMLRVKAYGLLDVKCTDDHRWMISEWHNRYDYNSFLAPSMLWVEAKDIRVMKDGDNQIIHNILSRVDERVNSKSSINRNRAWILGMFTAEGHLENYINGTPYGVGITINESEDSIADKFKELVKIEFGATHSRDKIIIDKRNDKDRRSRQVHVHSKELASFIRSHVIGRKAIEKSLSSGVMTLPRDAQEEFINAAWEGDGAIDETGLWILSTSSRKLCLQYQMILWRLGIPASAQYANKPKLMDGYQCAQGYRVVYQNNSDIHRIRFGNILGSKYVFTPVDIVEPCDCEPIVYDISVDRHSSFVTEGGLVHNCDFKDHCWSGEGKNV